MKARVNIRVALLLGATLFVAPAALGVSWYVFLRPDAARLMARGDAFAKAGDWRAAEREYTAALRLRGDDAELTRRLADALEAMPVADAAEADRTVGRILGVYRRWREIKPDDDEPLRRMFALQTRLGRDCGRTGAWDAMLRDADATLRSRQSSTVARKYRGIAQTQRMRSIEPPVTERAAARDDLLAALKVAPNDPDLPLAIATWRIVEAQLLDRPGGNPAEAQRLRAAAGEFTARSLADAPQDPKRLADHLAVLLETGRYDEARGVADRLKAALWPLRAVPADVALAFAEAKLRSPRPSDLVSGEERASPADPLFSPLLVLTFTRTWTPHDARLSYMIAQCEAARGRMDPAINAFDGVTMSASEPLDSVSKLVAETLIPKAKRRATELRCARFRGRAATAWIEGKPEEAVAALREAWQLAPSQLTLAELASALIASKKHADAASLLQQESDTVRGNPLLLAIRAESERDAPSRPAMWLDALGAAKSLAQFSGVAERLRGVEGVPGARAILETATRREGSNPTWIGLASAEMSIHAGDADAALAAVDRVARGLTPRSDEVSAAGRLRGLAHQKAGRPRDAEAAYLAVLSERADDRVALNNLVCLLTDDLNDTAAAREPAERLRALWPEDAQVLDTYGWWAFRAGKPDAAVAALRRSIAMRPAAETLYHLAMVESSRSTVDESRKLFEAAQRAAEREGNVALSRLVSDKLRGDNRR